jgi:hypothetical protein
MHGAKCVENRPCANTGLQCCKLCQMLPEFPKTAGDLLKFLELRINSRRKEIAPITDIGVETIAYEGRDFSYEQEGTGIVRDSYREFAVPVEVKFSDVPTLIGLAFEAKLEALAAEQAKQMSVFVHSRMNDIMEHTGTGVDAQGKPPSKELWLRMLDGMEISFDASGKPDLTFIAHPIMAEEMGKRWREWEEDLEFMEKHRVLMDRKREDFLDRESNRKLVD